MAHVIVIIDLSYVEQVRMICSEVDWPCDVKHLYRDTNLGCGLAVSTAIDWFFSYEEEGIILKDDYRVIPFSFL